MPAKSSAQRRWAFGVKGEKWARAHHFDTPGKLPARVGGGRKTVAGMYSEPPAEKAAQMKARVGGGKKAKKTLAAPGKLKRQQPGLKSHGKTHDGFKGCKFGC